MAKTTKRVTFTRTVTFTYTADMPGYGSDTDANALAAANLTNGVNSIGELLAGSTAAAGVINRGAWSVSGTGAAIEPYNIFVASYAYALSDRVVPATNPGNRMYIVKTAGTSAASEPAWNTTIGQTTTSGGATFVTVDKFVVVSTFATSTAYTVGQVVKPTGGSAFEYLCITAGTSGGTAPSWPSTMGTTVASGTATFQTISIG